MHPIISSNLLWTEGIYIVYFLCALALTGFFISRTLLWSAITFFLFSFYFFRNPDRISLEASKDSSVLISPADGTIVDIYYDHNNKLLGYAQRVSIFLSPIDVHVQWSPMAGKIEKIKYSPGEFTFAFLPKSSDLNEHNDLIIRNDKNQKILVRQIAGVVARRICCWAKEGEKLQVGQKYGMIRFGSRVDIYMPSEVELAVGVGQKVSGGQTVLGRWIHGISDSQASQAENK